MTEHTLIDRYVMAVGRLLGAKERDDIQLELRSTLQDMLEARSLDAANSEHEEAVAQMLKEFGSPMEIANSYRPQRYLIGPRYFPIFEQVIKIVATVIIGAVTLGILISGLEGQSLGQQFGNLLGNYLSALWSSLGIVTFVFFVLERTGVADDDIDEEIQKGWDPRDLPYIEDRNRVDYFGLVVELLFTMAFLVILNGAFGVVGPVSDFAQRWDFLADILNAVRPFYPLMVGLLSIELGLKFIVLVRGVWQPWSRTLEFLLTVGDLIIAVLFFNSAPFSATSWLDAGMRFSVLIVMLILIGVGLGQLYRLVWPQRTPPWEAFTKRNA